MYHKRRLEKILPKKKQYKQRLRDVWFQMPEFREWICRNPFDATRAYCRYCECGLMPKLSDLRSHAATRKHQNRATTCTKAKEQEFYKQRTLINRVQSHRCRICWKEAHESIILLFKDECAESEELVHKIEQIGGIVFLPLEDQPSALCANCVNSVNDAYKLRQQIKASEASVGIIEIDPIGHNETVVEILTIKKEVKPEKRQHANDDEIDEIEELEHDDDEDEEEENEKGLDEMHEIETVLEELEPETEICDEKSIGESEINQPIIHHVQQQQPPKLRKTWQNEWEGYQEAIKEEENGEGIHDIIEHQPQPIMCEICGNLYPKLSALNVHMRRHLPDKQFKCELCEKGFVSSSQLRNHMRVHTGEKPFTCKYCPRTFSDRSSNLRHERTHTNERPYTCTVCERSFTYPNALKIHMLTHTGEKPFQCVPCNKLFSRKHNLDQHIATGIHKKTVQKHPSSAK